MFTTLTPPPLPLKEKYILWQSLELVLMDAGFEVTVLQNVSDVLDMLSKAKNGLVILGVQNSDQILLAPTVFNKFYGSRLNGAFETSQEHIHYGGSLNEY